MMANSKVEIFGMSKGKRIRVIGNVKEDTRREARVAMMDANTAALSSMYTVDDGLTTVFAFENGSATVYSFMQLRFCLLNNYPHVSIYRTDGKMC